MSRRSLRQQPRISYCEPVEPNLDEYLFCEKCCDYVYEYCSIHGPLLVVPDDKIYDNNRKPAHCIDAADANKSNWMRYVNCARHWREQNLVAYQYRGELYYRTIKIIPRFTELMVFYGSEFACELDVDLSKYNSPTGYAQKFGAPVAKKRKPNNVDNPKREEKEPIKLNTAQTTKEETQPGTILNIEPVTQKHVEVIANVDDQMKKSNETALAKTVKDKNKGKATKDKVAANNKKTKNATTTTKTENENVKPTKAKVEDAGKPISNTDKSLDKIDVTASHATNKTRNLDHYVFCEYCNKRCMNNSELQKHLRFHDLSRGYECEICKLRYISLGNLNIHMNKHTKVKTFACKICDKKFNYSSCLKQHLRTHTGEKPYACEICDYKCSQSITLKRHIHTHTGEKPYACEICDYKFSRISTLKRHAYAY